MRDRNIAIVDLETSGLNPKIHEILEIGMVLVNQKTLEVIDTLDVKVKPEHIETASPRALAVNGYSEEEWKDAVPLRQAMISLTTKAKNAIFCGQNVHFDIAFVKEAFEKTGVQNLLDYHCVDLFTMSWFIFRNSKLDYFNLKAVTEYLKMESEPEPHCAFNGAMNAFEVYKRLINMPDVNPCKDIVLPELTIQSGNFAGSVEPLKKIY